MSEAKNKFLISSSPHIRANHSTSSIMRDVIFSLIPVLVFSTLYFGIRVLLIVALSVGSAVISEFVWQKLTKQKVTIGDCSAIVTGLLLAFNMPVLIPWWIPVIGSAFAIIIVKQIFGGLGQNFMNPALAARCFLLIAWTSPMTNFSVIDGLATATPLTLIQSGSGELPSLVDSFLGMVDGCIGETSSLLIMVGGVYLLIRGVIDFRIPFAYLATTIILTYILGGDGIYQVTLGGVMLGAFYMATDYATSPMNNGGKWIMGIGCGILTVLIRMYGGYPEGVSFSILFMNLCVPLIDRVTKPRVYGVFRQKKAKGGEAK